MVTKADNPGSLQPVANNPTKSSIFAP